MTVGRDARWLDIVLPRSHGRLVDIVFNDASAVPLVLDALVEHASRIRGLFFIDPNPTTYDFLGALMKIRMNALEEIMVFGCTTAPREGPPTWFKFAPSHCSALSALRCASAQVDWKAPFIRQLTTLSVMDAPLFHPTFTFDQFLEVLQDLADGSLRHLELHHSFPFYDNEHHTTDGPFLSDRIVKLPNLQTLSLVHSRVSPLRVMLSHMHLSLDVRLCVYYAACIGHAGDPELPALFDILPLDPRCIPIYRDAFSACIIAERATHPHHDGDFLTVSCWRESHFGSLTVTFGVVGDNCSRWTYNFDDLILDFIHLFRSSKLQWLKLEIEDTVPISVYHHGVVATSPTKHTMTATALGMLFAAFPDITHLEGQVDDLEWNCPMGLVDALWTRHDRPPPSGPGRDIDPDTYPRRECVLPRLRLISLRHVSCSPELIDALHTCIWARRAVFKSSLSELRIELMDPESGDVLSEEDHNMAVDVLKDVVPNVVCIV